MALDCLTANGPFNWSFYDHRVLELVGKLSAEAARSGGDALLALWQRIPEGTRNVSGFSGTTLDLRPDADFRGVMDALAKLQSGNRPLFLTGVINQWAGQYPDAAAAYVAETASRQKLDYAWSELREWVGEQRGKAGAEQWASDFFNRIPTGDLPDFIYNTGLLYSPKELLGSLPADAPAEERARLVAAMIESTDRHQTGMSESIFESLPSSERLAAIGEVRGLSNPKLVLDEARKEGASEAEIENLKALVTKPR